MLLLLACSSPSPQKPVDTACTPVTWYADLDADGAGAGEPLVSCTAEGPADATDCDDDDPAVHVGADESCNGRDDDCDGETDEDVLVEAWVDEDGDGYGGVLELQCEPGVDVGGDCDDTDAGVHPGALETCATPGDDDCDGVTNAPDTEGCIDYARDEDGDGHGIDETACLCEPAAPYTGADVLDDCDDTDARVYPDAEEIWADAADDDCDGVTDVTGAGEATARILGEQDGDQLLAVTIGDTDGDGAADLLVGAGGADDQGNRAGVAYLFHGPVAGGYLAEDADLEIEGMEEDGSFGLHLGTADRDGDGVRELIVAAPNTGCGHVYTFVDTTGTITTEDALTVWTGSQSADTLGSSLAAADLDGDGDDEVVAGEISVGDDTGGAAVCDGPSGPADVGCVELRGETRSDMAGHGVAAGDLDGDGLAEVVVGAPYHDPTSRGAGRVYVLDAPAEPGALASLAEATYDGAPGDLAGTSAAAGDLDGDGYGDLVAGGSVMRVLAGPLTGDYGSGDTTADLWTGDDDSQAKTVAVGDVDGDGLLDLFYGASGYDDGPEEATGAVFLAWGPLAGTLSPADGPLVYGEDAGDRLGPAVALGDVDGDGRADAAGGASNWEDELGARGAVYLWFGAER